jgi:hypothetical protein
LEGDLAQTDLQFQTTVRTAQLGGVERFANVRKKRLRLPEIAVLILWLLAAGTTVWALWL